MVQENGFFKTFDGLNLFYRFFSKPNSRRWMIILHGHGEHSGRYEKFADILSDQDISIAAFDARGSGRSDGREVYVRGFEDYLQDISCFLRFFRREKSVSDKVILLGHSMGGLEAMHWVDRNPEEISALILSSPCLGLRIAPHLKILNSVLNLFAPTFAYSNPVYPPYLSHSLEEVERYKRDPYVRRKITVRLLSEMINYAAKLQKIEKFSFSIPVYVLMAGLEKVVDADQTRKIYDKISAPHKLLKCFDHFYHEIFNELGQEEAFALLKDCLQNSYKFQSPAD